MHLPTFEDVRAARERIRAHVHRTPVHSSAALDCELEARVVFKCENLQKVGAFKARGATNAVLRLGEARARRGVITHSSGNHGAALAFAASIRGVPCTVVMPEDAPPVKVDAVRSYGAEIVFCRRAEREEVCERTMRERERTLIHPYEHPDVIAGQGTAALELLEDEPGLDLVVAPVGGGGLLSGTTIATRGFASSVEVLGAEPEQVDDAHRSLVSGKRQTLAPGATSCADGLLTELGELAFRILSDNGVRVITVEERSILEAAWWLTSRIKLVVEPSAAVGLAAVRRCAGGLRGRKVGVVLSGGNTDFAWLDDLQDEPVEDTGG